MWGYSTRCCLMRTLRDFIEKLPNISVYLSVILSWDNDSMRASVFSDQYERWVNTKKIFLLDRCLLDRIKFSKKVNKDKVIDIFDLGVPSNRQKIGESLLNFNQKNYQRNSLPDCIDPSIHLVFELREFDSLKLMETSKQYLTITKQSEQINTKV